MRWQIQVCEDDAIAEDVLLEVQRLWPPFFGGARVCTEVSTKLFLQAVVGTIHVTINGTALIR